LAARDVENPSANGQREYIEQARHFAAITFRSKKGFVLEEIVGVER